MSEYWGIPLLPFFSCAPAEKVPRFVFDFLAPSVRHFDGVAEKAPYGLRKLESSLLRKYGADEVVVAHPDHVSKFVDDKTSIIGISTMDPMGLGPVSMMFTDGGKLTAYTKRKFLELVGEINRTRKKYPKAKLVLGGSGGWQMEVRDRDTKALGVNHVVIGECDHVIGDIYNDIESNNSPEFIHVPRGPKLEEIPDIQAPSTHGLVEVMRGCGRNCQFCEPNLRIAKYYPKDKVEREIAVNRKIGNPNVWVHSEDIFLYKLEDKRGFMPNHDAVVDLFNTVMSQKGIGYANPTHGTAAPAWADPDLIRDISETVLKGSKRHIGIQSGLETGSSELIKKYMPLKVKPFSPDEWQDVIYNGTRIFNEYYWFPAYTSFDADRRLRLSYEQLGWSSLEEHCCVARTNGFEIAGEGFRQLKLFSASLTLQSPECRDPTFSTSRIKRRGQREKVVSSNRMPGFRFRAYSGRFFTGRILPENRFVSREFFIF